MIGMLLKTFQGKIKDKINESPKKVLIITVEEVEKYIEENKLPFKIVISNSEIRIENK